MSLYVAAALMIYLRYLLAYFSLCYSEFACLSPDKHRPCRFHESRAACSLCHAMISLIFADDGGAFQSHASLFYWFMISISQKALFLTICYISKGHFAAINTMPWQMRHTSCRIEQGRSFLSISQNFTEVTFSNFITSICWYFRWLPLILLTKISATAYHPIDY